MEVLLSFMIMILKMASSVINMVFVGASPYKVCHHTIVVKIKEASETS